jgi:hypothetical protein
MKFTFFLLLLANIAFYLWEARLEHGDGELKHIALNLPDTTERINLLSEVPPVFVDQLQTAAASPLVKTDAAVTPAKNQSQKLSVQPLPSGVTINTLSPNPYALPPVNPGCWLLGPFVTELNARIAQENVAGKVQQTSLVNRSAGVAEGYWLLYPRAESIDAGRDNRRMLLDKGIHDLWLFDRGELAGYISLGLYQTRLEAEQAQKKYFERNVATEIRPRETSVQGYWIEISWQGGRNQLESVLGNPGKETDGSRPVSLYPC